MSEANGGFAAGYANFFFVGTLWIIAVNCMMYIFRGIVFCESLGVNCMMIIFPGDCLLWVTGCKLYEG